MTVRIRRKLQGMWEKNWPEVQAAMTGGLPEFVLSARPSELKHNVPVFCYHVVDAPSFEADLDFLADNGYTTLDADSLLAHMEGSSNVPERSVVLTFDDGAENLYKVVWPALCRRGMQGVAFIATRFHPDGNEAVGPQGLPCSWSQIRRMHESGVLDFQSHTHEHRYVVRWPEHIELSGASASAVAALVEPETTLEDDYRRARDILQERLGKEVRHLCFPKFNGTPEAVVVARNCGYRACWWGVLPRIPDNRRGGSPEQIVRIGGEFLRRLPGKGRRSISEILYERHGGSARRLLGQPAQ